MNDLRIALSLQRSRMLREGGVCVEISHATPQPLPSMYIHAARNVHTCCKKCTYMLQDSGPLFYMPNAMAALILSPCRHNVTKWLVRDQTYKQNPPTQEFVNSYISDFSACIAQAVALGFNRIYVNPMVDGDYDQIPNQFPPWR